MQTLITPTVVVALGLRRRRVHRTRNRLRSGDRRRAGDLPAPRDGRRVFELSSAGDHADFADEYLAAPLALYVRYLIAPQLDLRHGQGGTVQPRSDELRGGLRRNAAPQPPRLLKTARRLLRRASDYLESHAAQFPLYDPQANVLNRCSIDGKLVQTR